MTNNSRGGTITPKSPRLRTGHFTGHVFLDINGSLMTKFTPEELLQYLYAENSPAQHNAIKKALEEDWTLREKIAVLSASMERLDAIRESPRTEVVLNVLNYARMKSGEVIK